MGNKNVCGSRVNKEIKTKRLLSPNIEIIKGGRIMNSGRFH